MKKVVLYDPGVSSMNLGDKVISEAAKEQLEFILKDSFSTEVSTHLPMSWYYMRSLKEADYKFVLGSNLLKSTFFGLKRQWDINLKLSKIIGPCILVGAGWWQYGNKPNLYTKTLLKTILSKDYIHSVRDEYTEQVLKSMGINNVINTSCATMWDLTREHCVMIKKEKSEKVVFTITDYNKDIEKDTFMINTLVSNYKKVYFWPQGIEDFNYFTEISKNNKDKIEVLTPSLDSFNGTLKEGDIDYVGTRLHAGIRALQNKVRSLIISIDNRALEKNKSFRLPILKREEINKLETIINNEILTDINIPVENIQRWKLQFKNNN